MNTNVNDRNINLYRFLVFNSLHLYIILNQLIDVSDNCTSLNIHQHKGRYNVAEGENKYLKSIMCFYRYINATKCCNTF